MSVHDIESWFSEDLANGGTLPSFAWPGGYPMGYVTENGDLLCPKCATDEFRSWEVCNSDDPPAGYYSYGNTCDYPEHSEQCDNCNIVICDSGEIEGKDYPVTNDNSTYY